MKFKAPLIQPAERAVHLERCSLPCCPACPGLPVLLVDLGEAGGQDRWVLPKCVALCGLQPLLYLLFLLGCALSQQNSAFCCINTGQRSPATPPGLLTAPLFFEAQLLIITVNLRISLALLFAFKGG